MQPEPSINQLLATIVVSPGLHSGREVGFLLESMHPNLGGLIRGDRRGGNDAYGMQVNTVIEVPSLTPSYLPHSYFCGKTGLKVKVLTWNLGDLVSVPGCNCCKDSSLHGLIDLSVAAFYV